MLYSAATLRYKNGISVVLSVKCQPSKLSEFLRVDNERSNAAAEIERERETERKQSVFVYAALWSGAWSCYGVATRTCLLYMRQRFESKVIVRPVLSHHPLPLTIHMHSHLFNINSVVWWGEEMGERTGHTNGVGMGEKRGGGREERKMERSSQMANR